MKVRMNSKELVKRAVEMKGPERLPVNITKNENSDIVFYIYKTPEAFNPDIPGMSEWGYVWERLDNTLGQQRNFLWTAGKSLKNTGFRMQAQLGALKV